MAGVEKKTLIVHLVSLPRSYAGVMRLKCLLEGLPSNWFDQQVVALSPGGASVLGKYLGRKCGSLGKRSMLGIISGKRLRDIVSGALRCVVHCWDLAAGWDARLALARPAGRVAVLLEQGCYPVGQQQRRRIRWLVRQGVEVVCPNQAGARSLEDLCGDGGGDGDGDGQNRVPRLIQPVVQFDRLDRADRRALRERLGIGPDQLLTVLGQPADQYCDDQRNGIWAGAIVGRIHEDSKLAIAGKGQAVRGLARFAASFNQGPMLIDGSCGLTELELILASDVFIACGKRGCDAQSLACAMAGRCGIVACGGAGGTEFLRDGDTCLTVNRAIPRLIAAAMLKLWEEPKLRERLGQNARAKAQELFMPTRIVGRYVRLYSQLIESSLNESDLRGENRSIASLLGAGYY